MGVDTNSQGGQPDSSSFLTPSSGGAGSASAASSNTTTQTGQGTEFSDSTSSSEAKGESSGSGSGNSGGSGSSGGSGGSGGSQPGYDIGASLALSDQQDTSINPTLGSVGGANTNSVGAESIFGNVVAPGASAAAAVGSSPGDVSSGSDTLLYVSIGLSIVGLAVTAWLLLRKKG